MSKRVTSDDGEEEKGTARAWCYTFFLGKNDKPIPCGIGEGDAPSEQDNKLHAHLRYFICQREVCPETGRVHWQAYGEFNDPVRGAAVFNAIRVQRGDKRFVRLERGAVHWERRRGRRDQARDYCRKQESRDERPDSGPFEFGMWPGSSERIYIRQLSIEMQHIDAHWPLYMSGECEEISPFNSSYLRFVPCIKL